MIKLAFGAKAVLPVKVGFPSYRIKHQDLEKNDEALKENLYNLSEIRLMAELKVAAFKNRISNA